MHVVASGSLLRHSWGKEGEEKIMPLGTWHKQIEQATESNFTQNEIQRKHREMEESNFCSIIKIGLFLWQNDNNFKITSLSTTVNSAREIQDIKYFCNYSAHTENFSIVHLSPSNCFVHQYPCAEFPAFFIFLARHFLSLTTEGVGTGEDWNTGQLALRPQLWAVSAAPLAGAQRQVPKGSWPEREHGWERKICWQRAREFVYNVFLYCKMTGEGGGELN